MPKKEITEDGPKNKIVRAGMKTRAEGLAIFIEDSRALMTPSKEALDLVL
jgi:hypothetical protein